MSVVFVVHPKSGQSDRKQDTRYDTGECYRSLNILAHAQLVNLDVGSDCGGHGLCGKDKIQLNPTQMQQINSPTEIERDHLSESELQSGIRLACQCFPNQDNLNIEVQALSHRHPA